jgi:2-polyprenyl-3-methyl-5-hydroxy-6-metoxy-1,4-benzoquinol methylase
MSLVLPLGEQPPANAFLSREQLDRPEARFPLDLFVCGRCALLQVPDHVPADFFRHYLYVPSAADTGRRHFAGLARWLLDAGVAPPGGRVVDVGCNDGLLLSGCAAIGLSCLGIDPASNLAPLARAKGLEVIEAYFDESVARDARARYGAADVVVTTNTLNHIDDLHGFVRAASALLGERGHLVIEVPRATELVELNEFDTVYHEHLSQFSLRSLAELVAAFDLEITLFEDITMHGGSMRVVATRRGVREASPAVAARLLEERRAGLFEAPTYEAFRQRVERNRETLVTLLAKLRAQGAKIAGYGAPAKGNTLLNYCGIGPETLEFLADRSTLKQGLHSPGMHVPVSPVERIETSGVDHLLVLAWNFFDEIREQQAAFRARGGRFIVPIPTPIVV